MITSMASMAHWVEHGPANWEVTGSIAGGAHAWVAGQVPGWGHARGRQSMFLLHVDVSLPLSPPSPLWEKQSNNKRQI